MGQEFSSIYELREIYRMKEELSCRESALSKPVLTDYSMLPQIYAWFSDAYLQGRRMSPMDRMKFIFIALFLYAPSSLAGRKMPDGLRDALSGLFPGLSPCVISNNKRQTVFFYEIYRRYGEELERLYSLIMEKIHEIPHASGPESAETVGKELYLWEDS